ncbi:hypothetical protein RN001_000661 [Aquatica leii]|uniref:OPA3-like protein CG13603 n=1 Tax=Aquatica leii TaxID=1421715 RepID=A0AAN7Q9U1_9COLE|nr:hypothetical protein RN001_000661 [Aquatica leii]
MVIGGFPVAKLGALLLRQASKPIANYIIEQAKKSPIFRTYICMPPAQIYNWCEVKTKMWILNLGRPINVPVLSEAMAIELGANLLGEALIFMIAAVILIREYTKSARKEYMKETQRQQEVNTLNNNVKELFFQVQEQHTQIRELLREVYAMQGKKLPVEQVDKDPKTPPPVQLSHTPLSLSDKLQLNNGDNSMRNENVLFSAVSTLEENLFNDTYKEREVGVLTVALNYLYTDVYKIPLRMY